MDDIPRRLTELEMLFTHLQRDFNHLNDVVIMQRHQIETLEKKVARLEGRLRQVDPEDTVRPFDLFEDRPPHY